MRKSMSVFVGKENQAWLPAWPLAPLFSALMSTKRIILSTSPEPFTHDTPHTNILLLAATETPPPVVLPVKYHRTPHHHLNTRAEESHCLET